MVVKVCLSIALARSRHLPNLRQIGRGLGFAGVEVVGGEVVVVGCGVVVVVGGEVVGEGVVVVEVIEVVVGVGTGVAKEVVVDVFELVAGEGVVEVEVIVGAELACWLPWCLYQCSRACACLLRFDHGLAFFAFFLLGALPVRR